MSEIIDNTPLSNETIIQITEMHKWYGQFHVLKTSISLLKKAKGSSYAGLRDQAKAP